MNTKELLDKAVELQVERTVLEKKNKVLQAKVKKLEKQLILHGVSQQRELLICVNKGNWGCLTEQKEYELLASYQDIYMIKDDDNAINNYDAKYFKKVEAN